MKRLSFVVVTLALLTCWLLGGPALAQAPPGPSVRAQSTFPATNAPAQFDLTLQLLDFAPGAWTPNHTHGGPVFVTVIEGELTVRSVGGRQQNYKAGEQWSEAPGEYLEVGNVTSSRTRVVVTGLTPPGVSFTTVATTGATMSTPPPGPTTVYRQEHKGLRPPAAAFDVVHLVLDFAPGTWTPPHTHGGTGYVLVTDGELMLRMSGMEHRYPAGQGWVDAANVVHAAGNPGPRSAAVAASFLLPRGASLTTVQPAGAPMPAAAPQRQMPPAMAMGQPMPRSMPRTGEGGPALPNWPTLLVGAGLLATGMHVRRRNRRR